VAFNLYGRDYIICKICGSTGIWLPTSYHHHVTTSTTSKQCSFPIVSIHRLTGDLKFTLFKDVFYSYHCLCLWKPQNIRLILPHHTDQSKGTCAMHQVNRSKGDPSKRLWVELHGASRQLWQPKPSLPTPL
jgi:hypothetical protein